MIIKISWLLRLKGWLGVPDALATTIGPITIVGDTPLEGEKLLHERIHHRQWWELLGVGYVLLFWWYYIKARVSGKDALEAYESNPFELEAYDNQWNNNYLFERHLWAWRRYVSPRQGESA